MRCRVVDISEDSQPLRPNSHPTTIAGHRWLALPSYLAPHLEPALLALCSPQHSRSDCTHFGNSLIGDPVYGTPTSKNTKWLALPERARQAAGKLSGQALHARVLGFRHPITGESLRFEAEPPAAWTALKTALEEES